MFYNFFCMSKDNINNNLNMMITILATMQRFPNTKKNTTINQSIYTLKQNEQ